MKKAKADHGGKTKNTVFLNQSEGNILYESCSTFSLKKKIGRKKAEKEKDIKRKYRDSVFYIFLRRLYYTHFLLNSIDSFPSHLAPMELKPEEIILFVG